MERHLASSTLDLPRPPRNDKLTIETTIERSSFMFLFSFKYENDNEEVYDNDYDHIGDYIGML